VGSEGPGGAMTAEEVAIREDLDRLRQVVALLIGALVGWCPGGGAGLSRKQADALAVMLPKSWPKAPEVSR
jgi:hypothetical protein